ncbi:hypothetical protein Pcinc_010190 [Petrolisthes cinctipes]|uniref:Uncharacterized protein n=1 Tax=Petrolisthes cinctipes TaxID=88211 RepID=A0AAE1G393_PETCI|nr:hypothetical protein Pcinc_010190 [Petrolisthes cinctipes]
MFSKFRRLAPDKLTAAKRTFTELEIEINVVQLGLDYNHLAREQQQDPEASATRTSITSLQWRDVPLDDSSITILCDISTETFYPHPRRRRRLSPSMLPSCQDATTQYGSHNFPGFSSVFEPLQKRASTSPQLKWFSATRSWYPANSSPTPLQTTTSSASEIS